MSDGSAFLRIPETQRLPRSLNRYWHLLHYSLSQATPKTSQAMGREMKCLFICLIVAISVFQPVQAKAPSVFGSYTGHMR